MIEAYFIHLLVIICIYLILAISLQLSVGFAGLLNLGHVAFYAVGAYTFSLLALASFPFWLSLAAAGVIAAVFGILLSIPTNKLKGDYLALATLGFSFVIYAVALNWTELTRGPLGLPGIPRPEVLGIVFSDNLAFLALTLAAALATFFIIRRIVNSPFGRVLQAVRDDELAARVLG
ncbi:branched-chain amino acid ABC transporter permease, partial [Candidatus Micrarchaeota archaeon]|nr:branched-chain amino acid ABC transporter permease [Candidatus Micrarchaeota archaeon]